MHSQSLTLLLVGAGKMGGALLKRWQSQPGIQIQVIEPNAAEAAWHKNLDALPTDYFPDVIVFAVKPQQLNAILTAYCERFGNHSPLYISIAAGKTLAFFAKYLGEHAHVVRAMPSLPATIGKGVTVLCTRDTLSQSTRNIAEKLMGAACAKVKWEDESRMDAVTAVSGSGPAYVFLFIESLIKAGIAAGLSEATAKMLAIQTVRDSTLLADEPNVSLEKLRQNVTSPGGTTEAALKVLMKDNILEKLIKDAVLTAAKRSKELAG